jgi:hypothetical protein
MIRMGSHSKPVNGVVMNGHAPSLAAFTVPPELQVRQGGPVTPWPQPAKPDRWRHVTSVTRVMAEHRGWLAAIPVILVNAVAFGAQLGFWRVHVPLAAEAVLVALALESIAIYLAWQAHLAQLADDSALRLRLAAYGMALVIGALNYSHFMRPGWRPTVEAVTFGMMSAISPWLWSVHSRRQSRDALKVKGLIEPHAVRLGSTRWTWHPIRSVRVMSHATWTGETDPSAAIATWKPRDAADVPADVPGSPSPDAPAAASPDEPEGRQEDVIANAVPASASPPDDVKPEPRKRTQPPSARTRALALLKGKPELTDAEVMKRARASKSTVERARRELAGAGS